jgi:hypothetical protein
MGKKSTRPNWILRIAGVLLCLTLLSVHLSSGLYARYTSTVSGSDSARVAKFEVKDVGTFSKDLYLEYNPGVSNSYTVVIENHSEVAVKCSVDVERLSNNIPLNVSISGDITDVTFAPNDAAGKTVRLALEWPGTKNDAAYSYEVDAIRVSVSVEQID